MKENRSLRNLLAVGGATGSRLVGTLVLYAVLARMLGPAKFGEFTYWYTIGIVLGALSDYGFGQQILIRLAADTPHGIKAEGERILTAKLILVVGLFAIAIFFSALHSTVLLDLYWIFPLLLACACATLIEFFGVMLRARGQYQNEAFRSFVATFVASMGAASVGYLTDSLILVCLIMFMVRISVLYFQYVAAKKAVSFEISYKSLVNFVQALNTLKRGVKFAIDGGAVQLFSNFDVLAAKHFLGPDSAGLYMAGSRVVQAALAGIPVLANVFIPLMVSNHKNGIRKTPKMLMLAIGSVSIGSILFFAFGANIFPLLLFGDGFSGLSDLMPALGFVVAMRYISSIDGFRLSVREKQMTRAAIHFVLTAAIVLVATYYSLTGTLTPMQLVLIVTVVGGCQVVLYRVANLRFL